MGRSLRSGRSTHQSISITLGPRYYREMQRLAAEIGVEADQLAMVWISDQINLKSALASLARSDLPFDGPSPAKRAKSAKTKNRASRHGRHDEGQSGGPVRPTQRLGLHDEIVSVLRQREQPMTAAEIAEAIRLRGLYRPPRSADPISGAIVSRRISNPSYRSLFSRTGRKVTLSPTA